MYALIDCLYSLLIKNYDHDCLKSTELSPLTEKSYTEKYTDIIQAYTIVLFLLRKPASMV